MEQINKIMEQITGRSIVEPLIEMLAENVEEFAEDKRKFDEAMHALEEELGTAVTPSVKEVEESVYQQAAILVLFSGSLGLKANIDHYKDPIARTFLDVDYDVFLREDTARRLPDYITAQETRNRFAENLSAAQQERYETITEYVALLETTMPKLAHYYGYVLGNELFPKVVLGYYPDVKMTLQYKEMMRSYFGVTVFDV